MSHEVILSIPDAPPSLNRLLRMNWRARHREMKRWRSLVWAARCQVMGAIAEAPIGKVKVTIERRSKYLLDDDNKVGSIKNVLDGLKQQNLIADDSPAHIVLEVLQSKGLPLTTIILKYGA